MFWTGYGYSHTNCNLMFANVLNMVRSAFYSMIFIGFSIFKFTNSLSKYYQ